MPELPEVETVKQGLVPAMEGKVIKRADIRRPDLRWPLPDKMSERLMGQKVLHLRRRAKYLLVDLSGGESLIVHLGMSGRLFISPKGEHANLEKHDHVVLDMDDDTRITFNDARRFGAMDLCATQDLSNNKMLAGLGPEPLGNKFDALYLLERFKGRKTPIKSALLDQRNVAGLGNIYVCEALWRSGISPTSKVGDLRTEKVEKLVPMIRDVLTEAIAAGGSSLKDYRQTDGELGYFQHGFAVYDREGQSCKNQGCSGKIERIVQSGRSTFLCPICQADT